MKKALCLLICLCVLVLSACAVNSPDPAKTLCEADVITVTTGTYICSMEMLETGCAFRFASPEILDDLVLTYDGTQLHACYDGIETDVPASFASALLPLYDAVRAFKMHSALQTAKNIRTVTLDETEFLLYYDTEGGMPTRLETKGADGVFGFDILSCTKHDDNAESTRTDTNK